MRRKVWFQDERKIAALYVGTLRERPSESGADGVRSCADAAFFSGREYLLSAGTGVVRLCVFPYVLPQYCEAVGGEPVVSGQRDEGEKMVSEPEEGVW